MKFLKTTMIFGFSLVLLTAIETNAQGGIFSKRNKATQYSTFGFGGGSSHYFGDLSSYSNFYYGIITTPRWNGTINYTRHLTPNFAARVAFSYVRIVGDDYTFSKWNLNKFWQQNLRNLHFRNDIKEFTFTGIFNLGNQLGKGPQSRSRVMPYGILGFGFYGHNPQARDVASVDPATGEITRGAWTNLKDKQTGGQGISNAYPKPYSLIQPVFPVGLGFRMKINDKFDFHAEGGFRVTPFDYLDDVGEGLYANPAELSPITPLGVVFANRAGEDIAARTGKDRVADFADIAINELGAAGTPTPSTNGTALFGFATNANRGTKRWDTYVVTQFTLSYIINNKVKCPPIK